MGGGGGGAEGGKRTEIGGKVGISTVLPCKSGDGAKRNEVGGKVEVVLLFSECLIHVDCRLTINYCIAYTLIHLYNSLPKTKFWQKRRYNPNFNCIALPVGG